ncbi:hypothetical protein ONZ45_g7717 [Pleurotus djamor]|nr:hypothetical protein ONZ45_g7717 [Pleurotus djamor]
MALRRIKMMLWTIMLPEMMVFWATKQWVRARRISRAAQERTQDPAVDPANSEKVNASVQNIDSENVSETPIAGSFEWTQTHSYFLLMGGFAVADAESKSGSPRSINEDDVLDGRIPWPVVTKASIMNGSKGDALAKAIVLLQVTWYIAQLCSRAIQGLAVTELEIMTLTYAVICALLYAMWFPKPYDVQQPILIPGSANDLVPRLHTPLSLKVFVNGLWMWLVHERTVEDPVGDSQANEGEVPFRGASLLFSATLFGGIHLIAWNFAFPSRVEWLLWISASLGVTALPPVYGTLLFLQSTVCAWDDDTLDESPFRDRLLLFIGSLLSYSYLSPMLHNAYFIARIILFVQSFVLLRDLSPSALEAVSWSSFFPHI